MHVRRQERGFETTGHGVDDDAPRDEERPVWKSKFCGAFVLNRRVVLHAIDATPARWRGDAGSSSLDQARTAASSPRKMCTRRTLISTQGIDVSLRSQPASALIVAEPPNNNIDVTMMDVRSEK